MTRKEMIQEAKRIALALDELVDEIEADGGLTEFGINRTVRDLRTARLLTTHVAGKLGEEATWRSGT